MLRFREDREESPPLMLWEEGASYTFSDYFHLSLIGLLAPER